MYHTLSSEGSEIITKRIGRVVRARSSDDSVEAVFSGEKNRITA